jgi:hypothetical protein
VAHAPTRLLAAAFAAAVVLATLATAAAAAQGGWAPAAPPPTMPSLARVAAPHPMPAGVVTPLPQPEPRAPKPKATPRPRPTPTSTTTTSILPPPPPAPPPAIPDGKGMWIWQPGLAEAGNVPTVVARATGVGLTHVFVRTGSTWDGLENMAYLDQLLPAAHAAGLEVYGWDFPKLADPAVDVARAMDALNHVAPGNNRLDGFAPDIETATEGTQFTPAAAQAYGAGLRAAAGPSRLLVAVVPNPTPQMQQKYSYDAVVPAFDAIAPMIYWLNREPGTDTANAMQFLARYGKPLMPIGQAYDGGAEGGRPGVPPPAELLLFMDVAKQYGATAVSFWSWQHVNQPAWDAIKAGPSFLPTPKPKPQS